MRICRGYWNGAIEQFGLHPERLLGKRLGGANGETTTIAISRVIKYVTNSLAPSSTHCAQVSSSWASLIPRCPLMPNLSRSSLRQVSHVLCTRVFAFRFDLSSPIISALECRKKSMQECLSFLRLILGSFTIAYNLGREVNISMADGDYAGLVGALE